MRLVIKYLVIFVFSWTLFACGGGGGSDDDDTPEAAKISSENEENLGTAAAEGAIQAVDSEDTAIFRPGNASRRAILELFSKKLSSNTAGRLANAPETVDGICDTGTITIDVDADGDGIIDVDNCVIFEGSESIALDGTVTIQTTETSTTIRTVINYNDFTVTYSGGTEVVDFSSDCTTVKSTGDTSCTFSSQALGIDERTYSISNASVSGDDINGYTISATITDPDHGTITITTTSPILFNCSDDRPSSGTIVFTDSDGTVVTVTFNDCTSFTISYDGNSTVYTW